MGFGIQLRIIDGLELSMPMHNATVPDMFQLLGEYSTILKIKLYYIKYKIIYKIKINIFKNADWIYYFYFNFTGNYTW